MATAADFSPLSPIAVHGAGYLGMCTALHYAHRTPRVVYLFDPSAEKTAQLQDGRCPVPGLEQWGGYRVRDVVESLRLRIETAPPTGRLAPHHFICVPTHVDGDAPAASLAYVDTVLEALEADAARHPPATVVVESTLPPWAVDEVVRRIERMKAVAVIATRRDWFADSKWNLRATPRVAWTSDLSGLWLLAEVCDAIVPASSARAAAMVKVAENALYHVEIAFAQRMALAFPEMDTVELMQLVGTHPSRPQLHPSGRVGGYCVPFGSRVVLQAAGFEEAGGIGGFVGTLADAQQEGSREIPMVADALDTNDLMVERVLGLVAGGASRGLRSPGPEGRAGPNVLLLGITYRPDTKVTAESLSRALARRLGAERCRAYDPWYSADETTRELGVLKAEGVPESFTPFDVVVVGTAHAEFSQWFRGVTAGGAPLPFRPGTLVIDSLGAWGHMRDRLLAAGVDYRRIGDAGWDRREPITSNVGVYLP